MTDDIPENAVRRRRWSRSVMNRTPIRIRGASLVYSRFFLASSSLFDDFVEITGSTKERAP